MVVRNFEILIVLIARSRTINDQQCHSRDLGPNIKILNTYASIHQSGMEHLCGCINVQHHCYVDQLSYIIYVDCTRDITDLHMTAASTTLLRQCGNQI